LKYDAKSSSSLRIILIAAHILLIPITVVAQTNEQLLKDGLISPYMFNLLNKQGAKTPEARIELIKKLCATGDLKSVDCEQNKPSNWTYR
jgi:hypothetical protein